jgi:hypothetical protein
MKYPAPARLLNIITKIPMMTGFTVALASIVAAG